MIEVSAIFVARMHFLEPRGVGVKAFNCCEGWREEYMGYTRTWSNCEILKHRVARTFYRHKSLRQLACVQPYRRTKVFNLFLPRKEYQHISSAVAGVDLEEGTQSRFHKVWLTDQCMEYMHVVLPSLHIDLFSTKSVASVGPPASSWKG